MAQQKKNIIVTGASAGIGRAIALHFGRRGYRVGLIARDAEALLEARHEVETSGGTAAISVADVSDAAALQTAADELEQKLGPMDIWINNAMETVFSTISDITPEEFERVTRVTYLGCVHGTMIALRSMRPRNAGCIVQIGSALAYRGIPLQSAYCGAKHAIRGFTDSLRTELLHEQSKIRVTMVDLPAVNTPQFDWARARIPHLPRPMGQPLEPERVAEAVYRAAHGRWREYWLGGMTLITIVGNTIAPSLLDRYLAKTAFAGQQRKAIMPPDRQDNLDKPVTALHRTRGSFSSEARDNAFLFPAPLLRAGIVLGGALACMVVGWEISRSKKPRRRLKLSSARHLHDRNRRSK